MLKITLDEVDGTAVLEPDGKLSAEDFASAARIIDPCIERSGRLKGLIIHVESFPGWDSLTALLAHFRFVRTHHRKISRIAVATDSILGSFGEHVASHFIRAEIKRFRFSELGKARSWILAANAGQNGD